MFEPLSEFTRGEYIARVVHDESDGDSPLLDCGIVVIARPQTAGRVVDVVPWRDGDEIDTTVAVPVSIGLHGGASVISPDNVDDCDGWAYSAEDGWTVDAIASALEERNEWAAGNVFGVTVVRRETCAACETVKEMPVFEVWNVIGLEYAESLAKSELTEFAGAL